jgi:hypothetical protein
MKKIFIFLALLATLFSYSIVQAESVSLISSSFSITGKQQGWCCNWGSEPIFSGSYNVQSTTPIADGIAYQGYLVTYSGADVGMVRSATSLRLSEVALLRRCILASS